MTKKRKSGVISPNSDNKETKRKMATAKGGQSAAQANMANQQASYNQQQSGAGQASASFFLPPYQYQPPSPYYMNPGSPVLSQNSSPDCLQLIMQRLDAMDKKLNQLSTIQTSVNKITNRLDSLESKITDIEASQKFVSDQYDVVVKTSETLTTATSENRSRVEKLSAENKELRSDKDSLVEDIIDLKCRSMRDNLLFFGVPEQDLNQSQGQTGNEDCVKQVFDFCENVLKIPDPQSKIQVDRAHRVGRFAQSKTRPIVAKFQNTSSKMSVKESLKTIDLKNTKFNVSEQYPQEIKDRRKDLIPIMIEARKEGKRAVLVRDKLFINNQLYTPNASRNQRD